jgi:hypothetical protein
VEAGGGAGYVSEDGGMIKRCIIEITPDVLAEMLQLPVTAIVEEVRTDVERCGVLQIRVSGCGWETNPGDRLRVTTGTMYEDGTIKWEFAK